MYSKLLFNLERSAQLPPLKNNYKGEQLYPVDNPHPAPQPQTSRDCLDLQFWQHIRFIHPK